MIKPTMGLVLATMSITVGLADRAAARPVSGGHSGSATAACTPDHVALTDLDGDGNDDIVLGRPVTAGSGIGAIDVHATCAGDATISGTQFAGATGAFGSAVALARIGGGDEFIDALVGDPGTSSGGSVFLLTGGPGGLTPSPVRLNGRSAGERFGATVITNGQDVWVSAPDRTVDGVAGAGAVDHWRLAGNTASLLETITEATPAAHGTPTSNAHFGAVLSPFGSGLWIGTPDDTVDHHPGAGSVTELNYAIGGESPTSGRRITQDTDGVAGVPEAGDHFGAAVAAGSAIGAPGEDLGKATDAGLVQLFTLDSPDAAVSQDSPGVPGAVESGDQFGASLAYIAGDVAWTRPTGLLIGSPGEGLGTQAHAGAVWYRWLRYDLDGVQWTVERQGTGSGGVGGAYEANDRFGQTLSVAYGNRDDDEDLQEALVGTPGEDVGSAADAGLVSRFNPPYDTGTSKSYFAVGGNRAGLRYGTVLPYLAALRPQL